jgi:hypothetical protein
MPPPDTHYLPAPFTPAEREAFESIRAQLKKLFPMFALVAVKDPDTSAAITICAHNKRDAEDMAYSLMLAVKTSRPHEKN